MLGEQKRLPRLISRSMNPSSSWSRGDGGKTQVAKPERKMSIIMSDVFYYILFYCVIGCVRCFIKTLEVHKYFSVCCLVLFVRTLTGEYMYIIFELEFLYLLFDLDCGEEAFSNV